MTTDLANQQSLAPGDFYSGSMNLLQSQGCYPTVNPYAWWPYQTYYPHICPTPPVTYITQATRCAWCQGTHTGGCDRLKSVTYRKDGTVERVEFFEADG